MVNFDFCMFEMKSADAHQVRHARKRTPTICISRALLTALTKYCGHARHQHVTMVRVERTRHARVDTEKFCKTVCETIMKEKNNLDNTSGFLGRLMPNTSRGRSTS